MIRKKTRDKKLSEKLVHRSTYMRSLLFTLNVTFLFLQ